MLTVNPDIIWVKRLQTCLYTEFNLIQCSKFLYVSKIKRGGGNVKKRKKKSA